MKLTEPQSRLLAELKASENGWVPVSGPRLRTAEALVRLGKADTIGVRDPVTAERGSAFTGRWCWTLESTDSDYFSVL